MRDLDAFKPLVANEQVMSNISAEDRTLLGNVLVQTPAYVINRRNAFTFAPGVTFCISRDVWKVQNLII